MIHSNAKPPPKKNISNEDNQKKKPNLSISFGFL